MKNITNRSALVKQWRLAVKPINSKTMKRLQLFFLLVLMLPITAFAHSVNADYTFIKEINVNGVVYRCYRVSANWGRNAEYSKYLGTAARIKSLTGVQSSEFVIPSSVYDGDQEYAVSTIVQPVPEIAEACVSTVLSRHMSNVPSLICLPVKYACGGTTKDK